MGEERPEAFGVGLAGDATFGDDSRDVTVRGDVKRRVARFDICGGDQESPASWVTSAEGERSSMGIWPPEARRKSSVEMGAATLKGNAMLVREHRHRVGADLVGHIAIGRNAVGPDNDCLDLALPS